MALLSNVQLPITTIPDAKEYYGSSYMPGENPSFIEISVEDAFKALVRNGFEHIRGDWVHKNSDGTILAGCAIGQMGVNLGAAFCGPCGLESQLNRFGDGAGSEIITYNDWKSWNLENQEYDYHSWNEVVAFARRLLEPHFNETLILEVREYKVPENLYEQLTTPDQ